MWRAGNGIRFYIVMTSLSSCALCQLWWRGVCVCVWRRITVTVAWRCTAVGCMRQPRASQPLVACVVRTATLHHVWQVTRNVALVFACDWPVPYMSCQVGAASAGTSILVTLVSIASQWSWVDTIIYLIELRYQNCINRVRYSNTFNSSDIKFSV